MHLPLRLASLLACARHPSRTSRPCDPERDGSGRPGGSGASMPALAEAALRADPETWLVTRAISLRAF